VSYFNVLRPSKKIKTKNDIMPSTSEPQTEGIQKMAWETATYNHELKTLTQEAL